ncbi:MAG: MerR family transcriptional regulator [Coriobacteriales bacterium]|jgi:DNA-binding transcriptional MerR regulator
MKRRDGTNLFTLGEMAKLTQLSPKTLRFYDEKGTVSPHWRDPETGYRYYDTDQLYRLGNMRIAKALGLPMRGYDDVVVTSDELEGRDFDPVASRIREAQGEKAAEIAAAAQQLRLLERLSQDVSILRSHEVGGGSFLLDCPRLHLLAYLPPRGDGPATLESWYERQSPLEWACLPRYGRLQGMGTLMSGFVDVRGFCCEMRDGIPLGGVAMPQDFFEFELPAGNAHCWLVTGASDIGSWEPLRRCYGAFDPEEGEPADSRDAGGASTSHAVVGIDVDDLDGKLVLMQECGFFEDYSQAVFLVRVIDDPRA